MVDAGATWLSIFGNDLFIDLEIMQQIIHLSHSKPDQYKLNPTAPMIPYHPKMGLH
jgi:hypothetical protein